MCCDRLGILLLFSLLGGFCIWGAWQDFDWFMNNHRARLFVLLFGRQGARVFYIIFGMTWIVAGFAAVIFG